MFAEAGTEPPVSGISYGGLMRRPEVTGDMIKRHMSALSFLSSSEAEELFTDVRYEGYLERQEKARAESVRLENMRIPEGTDYAGMHGLRREAAEKLERIRPDDDRAGVAHTRSQSCGRERADNQTQSEKREKLTVKIPAAR